MTEAVQCATNWAFETLRVRRVWANVMAPNVGSIRVLEKAGYILEAKMTLAICDRRGMIHDELIYARMRPELSLLAGLHGPPASPMTCPTRSRRDRRRSRRVCWPMRHSHVSAAHEPQRYP